MEGSKMISKIIPEGELKCIWAEAGLVSYKLCDRGFECDDCPFDQVMRQRSKPASDRPVSGKPVSGSSREEKGPRAREWSVAELVNDLFTSPASKRLPSDRLYSRGHVWIKSLGEERYRIGVDHYAADLLVGVKNVAFPQTGSAALKNNPCAWLICDDGTLVLHSPISGRIRASNPALMESARLVADDPYETGWLNDLHSDGDVARDCFDSAAAESLFAGRFDEVRSEIIGEIGGRPSSLGVTLMDGGARPRNLRDLLGPSKYLVFIQEILSTRA